MKKAIVSGANGFIGASLCKELTCQGVEVIAIVRDKGSDITDIKGLSGIKIVYSDLSSFTKLDTIISDRDVNAFFHLAWTGSAGPQRGDVNIQIQNIQYTCDAVKVCQRLGCSRFVFASSIMEYEVQAAMKTEHVPGIETLYSSAKAAANHMARAVAGAFGIDYIRAVISNIYGPGEKSPRLINTSLRKLLSGEHCAFSEGVQTYDFIYITDAVKSMIAIADKGSAGKSYYIGSSQPRPLREFLIEMKDQIDQGIEIGLGEIPFNGVSLNYTEFDIDAIRKDTGFIPEVSFAEGISNTIKWLKEAN